MTHDSTHLFNDWTLVEIQTRVMSRRANEFDTSFVCTMIGLGSHECRKEGMMNVNDLERVAKVGRDDLHVASQNHQIHLVGIFQQFDFLLLLFHLVVFCDFEDLEGNVKGVCHMLQVGVIGDNARDVTVEFPRAVSQQELPQAVLVLADHDRHSLPSIAPVNVRLHLKALAHFLDALFHGDAIRVHARIIEMDALKEQVRLQIRRLLRIHNATAVAVNELTKGSDDSLLIGSVDTEGRAFLGGALSFVGEGEEEFITDSIDRLDNQKNRSDDAVMMQ
jgi:hypothetical protein